MEYKKIKVAELQKSIDELISLEIHDYELEKFRKEMCLDIKIVCSKVEEGRFTDQETFDIFNCLGSFFGERINDNFQLEDEYSETNKKSKDAEPKEVWNKFKDRFSGLMNLKRYLFKYLIIPNGCDREYEKEKLKRLQNKIEQLQQRKKENSYKEIEQKQIDQNNNSSSDNFEIEYSNYKRRITEMLSSWLIESISKTDYI